MLLGCLASPTVGYSPENSGTSFSSGVVSGTHELLLANLFQHHKAELSIEVAPKPGRLQKSDRRGEISALPGSPTVAHERVLTTAYEKSSAIFRRVSGCF
jgi:hypothetical protein